jgi:type I restriction enzyme S subunit
MSTGSTVLHINVGDIKKLPLRNLPSFHDQERIANILHNLELRVECNLTISRLLEEIAQTIFKSWFVDFDPVKAKMVGEKPGGMDEVTASLFPDSMEYSALGPIPTGWKVAAIGDIARLKGGKQLAKEAFRANGSYPIFGGAGIMGFADVYNADGFVITLGRVGANCGQFFNHRGKAWVNNNATRVEHNAEFGGEWFFLTLKAFNIESIKKGAAQPFVSNSDLAESKVLIPSKKLIDAFTSIIQPMFLKSESLIRESSNLVKIRDGLLPKLISGELQIPEEMLVS